MRGLLLNLVATLANDDDCADEVWELVLALGRARKLAALEQQAAATAPAYDDRFALPDIGGGPGFSLAGLMRDVLPSPDAEDLYEAFDADADAATPVPEDAPSACPQTCEDDEPSSEKAGATDCCDPLLLLALPIDPLEQ